MKKIIISTEAKEDIISMYSSGAKIKDITRKHKINDQQFYKLLKEYQITYRLKNEVMSKIDIEKLRELYNSGITQTQLAKELNVANSTICNLMKLHKIPVRKYMIEKVERKHE